MPKVRSFATRTIKNVPLVFEDAAGERVTEKFTVVYKSYSTTALAELTALEEAEGKEGVVPFAAYLEKMVVSITDADDEPVAPKLDRAFFDALALAENTEVIYEAIRNDINPQKASPAPGGSESKAD